MTRRTALLAGGALFAAAVWPPLTGLALHLADTGLTAPEPGMLWPGPAYYYARDYGDEPVIRKWLPISAGGAGLVAVAPAVAGFVASKRRRLTTTKPGRPVPKPERAASDLHGSARFMTDAEARAKFRPDPEHGGIVIGMLDDGTLLRDPCETGSLWAAFAGSRGGKTSSITIPTLDPAVGWSGPVLVFDPAGEVSHMVGDMRRAAGQRVVVVKPGQPGFNVLDWIDINDPAAPIHVERVVELIGKSKPKDGASKDSPIWRGSSKMLQNALLLDLLAGPVVPANDKTLREFARRASAPALDLKHRMAAIFEQSASPMARYRAGQVMETKEDTFKGFALDVQSDIGWLLNESYATMVSEGPMRSDDLVRGDLSVFVEIPMMDMDATPEIGRTVINALFQGVYRHEGRVQKRILAIIEDMNLLGNMAALAQARDNAAKFGLRMLCNWQAAEQIAGTWGISGKGEWLQNAAGEIYIGQRTQHAAEEVSKRCGTYTAFSRTEGRSRGRSGGTNGAGNSSRNEGLSEVAAPVYSTAQVQQLVGRIVFWARQQDGKPDPLGPAALQCAHPFWYRLPSMKHRVRPSPFRVARPAPDGRGRRLWAALTARLRV